MSDAGQALTRLKGKLTMRDEIGAAARLACRPLPRGSYAVRTGYAGAGDAAAIRTWRCSAIVKTA